MIETTFDNNLTLSLTGTREEMPHPYLVGNDYEEATYTRLYDGSKMEYKRDSLGRAVWSLRTKDGGYHRISVKKAVANFDKIRNSRVGIRFTGGRRKKS